MGLLTVPGYIGGYAVGGPLDFLFSTHTAAGAPITLGGAPAVSVYKGNTATPSTTDVTLNVDYNTVTGLHHVRVATSDAWYAAGLDYTAVLSAGTVDGVSVAGRILAAWDFQRTQQAIRDAMGLANSGRPAVVDPSIDHYLTAMPADIWEYTTRTLTQAAASVTAAVTGSDLSIQRGDTVIISLTGLGNITLRSKLWFGLKGTVADTDAQALILLEETAGLTVLNGAAYATPTDATLVVTNATTGAVTITLKPAITSLLSPVSGAVYDMQWKNAANAIYTLTAGAATVTGDVVRAVS